MLYFVSPGGRVIFDIMNKDSEWKKAMVARKNRLFVLAVGTNVIKFVANLVMPGRYIIDTIFRIRDIMYSPSKIEAILKNWGWFMKRLLWSKSRSAVAGGGLVFSRPEVGLYRP